MTSTYQGVQHSTLVQRHIRSAMDCYEEFAYYGSDGRTIPVVLKPGRGCNGLDCLIPGLRIGVSVPSGPYVLWQEWHNDMGELEPGVKWIWPFYKRISHIVSSAALTYSAPAQNCPTADNVPVDVDVSLTFQIGPDADAARKFVYRLGAHRFDEMLRAECEEAIRGLVYSVTHDKVNDLREEFAGGMKAVLNEKFGRYGIMILAVKVTDVMLPFELQKRLQDTTAFKTRMGETEKVHENKVRVLKDSAVLELETIRKSNARRVQEIKAESQRYDIERHELEIRAKGEARVQIAAEERIAEVKLKTAQADEVVKKIWAKEKAESLIRNTEIECQKQKIKADEASKVMIKRSEALLQVAKLDGDALIAKAEAEMEGASKLAEKRSYELEWQRLTILQTLAGHGRKFITEEEGEMLLNSLIPKSELLHMK